MSTAATLQSIVNSACQLLDKAGDFVSRLDAHPGGAMALVALVAIGTIGTVMVAALRRTRGGT